MSDSKPMLEQLVTVDDAGIPTGVLDVRTVNEAATRLTFELVAACHSDAELARIVRRFQEHLGPTTYRYTAALALTYVMKTVVRDAIDIVEKAAPELRMRSEMSDAAVRARENFPIGLGPEDCS